MSWTSLGLWDAVPAQSTSYTSGLACMQSGAWPCKQQVMRAGRQADRQAARAESIDRCSAVTAVNSSYRLQHNEDG